VKGSNLSPLAFNGISLNESNNDSDDEDDDNDMSIDHNTLVQQNEYQRTQK
jgi:hypothetical protein